MNFKTLLGAIIYFLIMLLNTTISSAQLVQKIGDNPLSISPSSVLELESTSKGFLPPRMTAAQRMAIGNPAQGLLIFQTDAPSGLYYYTSAAWAMVNPMSAIGDMIYGGTSGTGTRLAAGSEGEVLTMTSGIPSWAAFSGVTALGPISETSTSNGATITSGTLNLSPASATHGGLLTTGAQAISGSKTFSSDATINALTIGKGAGNSTSINLDNTAFGRQALKFNTTGLNNTAVGSSALTINSVGNQNTAVGSFSLKSNTTGIENTAVGFSSLNSNSTGSSNTAYGNLSLGSLNSAASNNNTAIGSMATNQLLQGANNTAVGGKAGLYYGMTGTVANTVMNNSVLIGYNARPNASGETNEIVIGSDALGNGNNTVQLGNTDITNVKTSGTITAGTVTYPKVHNSVDKQVLTTNGSGIATWQTPTAYVLPTASTTVLGGVKVGANLSIDGSGVLAANLTSANSIPYIIGLNSSLGGYVVYVTPDGNHGIVCATQDQITSNLRESQNEISSEYYHNSDGKKFTDWRLPTIYELTKIYDQRAFLTGISATSYLSSTYIYYNYYDSGQRILDFTSGTVLFGVNGIQYRIRAVRSF